MHPTLFPYGLEYHAPLLIVFEGAATVQGGAHGPVFVVAGGYMVGELRVLLGSMKMTYVFRQPVRRTSPANSTPSRESKKCHLRCDSGRNRPGSLDFD